MESNPYTPLAASLRIPGAPEQSETAFRDLSALTRALSILLMVGLGCRVLHIGSLIMQWNLVSHAPYSLAAARANDLRERLAAVGQLVVFCVTAFVFLRWIYLAHKNLPELGARLLRSTPAWSVGSFFIPIVGLWAPYQAMRDLLKASRSPRHWQLEDTPFVIVLWWVLWLITRVLGNGMLPSVLGRRTVEQLQQLTALEILTDSLMVPVYLLVWYIVRRVWRDQSANSAPVSEVSVA